VIIFALHGLESRDDGGADALLVSFVQSDPEFRVPAVETAETLLYFPGLESQHEDHTVEV
jgi:hypothetical protein